MKYNNVQERFSEYDKDHCWQYEIRNQNKASDVEDIGLSEDEIKALRISDFTFNYIPKDNKIGCKEVKDFIEKHEWLGKMPIWVTHRFVVRHTKSGVVAGVTVMATPNSFSNLLGAENKDLEKLIARGACISWSPKNLASYLTMQSIKWMVHNTDFRYFTAYSDPEAKELGTIYQACNFHYLGQTFGSGWQYLDKDNKKRGWFGSSGFSDRSQIVRYAKKLGIEWQKEWYKITSSYRKVNWKAIPDDIAKQLKDERTRHRESCEKRRSPAKHKYAYILGRDKKETRKLMKLFKENSPDKIGLPYPKNRGD